MTTKPGQRLTREQIAQYADVAARLRHLVSQRTLAPSTRAARATPAHRRRSARRRCRPRRPRSVEAARRRARALASRWLGEPARRSASSCRISTARASATCARSPVRASASRSTQSATGRTSLAAQGDVIDGYGTLRTENGKVLLDIKPTDGSASLTLEVGGPSPARRASRARTSRGGCAQRERGRGDPVDRARPAEARRKDGPHRDAAAKALARSRTSRRRATRARARRGRAARCFAGHARCDATSRQKARPARCRRDRTGRKTDQTDRSP